jgi:uncharacterized protein (TIGR01777 family)
VTICRDCELFDPREKAVGDMKALVTGATGFIGRKLIARLERPVVLSRNAEKARQTLADVEAYSWDAERTPAPARAFEGVDVVFHLAGEPVAEGRWSDEKKRRIRESRRLGTKNLVEGMRQSDHKPGVLVSASAVGYYGDRGDEILDEQSPPGNDFLAQVCREWEAAALAAQELGLRVTNPRIGIVLGNGGGALEKMLPPFRLGLGGRLASGRQWMPWVHVDDIVGMLLYAAQQESLRGPFNAVAPHPCTNREFTQQLASALHRPALFPVPALALKIAVGEFGQILLASQRAIPRAIQAAGYQFAYPELRGALAAIVG